MATTKINAASVISESNSIINELSSQEVCLNSIAGLIVSMQSSWDSPAQNTFAVKFNASKSEIENFNVSVREFAKKIIEITNSYANADKTAKDKIISASFE